MMFLNGSARGVQLPRDQTQSDGGEQVVSSVNDDAFRDPVAGEQC